MQLIRYPSYITQSFYFFNHFFSLKFPSYEKLAMASQFDLAPFYDVIICNSVFQHGFLTWELQIAMCIMFISNKQHKYSISECLTLSVLS